MIKVHQCEAMAEKQDYILIDECSIDGELIDTRVYKIESYSDEFASEELRGGKVNWLHCPYCGERLEDK